MQELWEGGHTTAVTEHPISRSLSVWGNCCSPAVGAASSNVSGDLEAASTARHQFASMQAPPRCSTPGSFPRCHCFSHCPPLLGSRELVRLCGAAMCCCLDLHPYAACPTYASSQPLAPSANTHPQSQPPLPRAFPDTPGVSPHSAPEGNT